MEKTFLRLTDKQILFVCYLVKLVPDWYLVCSVLREQSFLRMKLLTTDYEFLCL